MPSQYLEERHILIFREDHAGTQRNLNEQVLLGFLLAQFIHFVLVFPGLATLQQTGTKTLRFNHSLGSSFPYESSRVV